MASRLSELPCSVTARDEGDRGHCDTADESIRSL